MNNKNIVFKRKIDKLYESYRILGYNDSIKFLEQLSYLILIKMIHEDYLTEFTYTKYYDNDHINKSFNWPYLKDLNRSDIINVLERENKDALKKIFEDINPSLNFISGISFNSSDSDFIVKMIYFIEDLFEVDKKNIKSVLADTIDMLIEKILHSGNAGTVFIPQHLSEIIVEMIEPKGHERVFDPSMRCGEFFVTINNYIKKTTSEEKIKYFGNELDKNVLRIAKINLFFHKLFNAHIENNEPENYLNTDENRYDIIISTPPVGKAMNQSYSVGAAIIKDATILYVTMAMEKLEYGGRCALVVPEGFLFKARNDYTNIRKKLVNEYCIDGIVSLPQGIFSPHTGGKFSILFFTRPLNSKVELKSSEEVDTQTKQVWFYELKSDGVMLDSKRKPLGKSDLPDLLEKWMIRNDDYDKWTKVYQSEKVQEDEHEVRRAYSWPYENIWFTDYEEIHVKEYILSAASYKPYQMDRIEYESPQKILNEILTIEMDVTKKLRYLIEETKNYG